MAIRDRTRYEDDVKDYQNGNSGRKMYIEKVDLRKKLKLQKSTLKSLKNEGVVVDQSSIKKDEISYHQPSEFALFVKDNMERIK